MTPGKRVPLGCTDSPVLSVSAALTSWQMPRQTVRLKPQRPDPRNLGPLQRSHPGLLEPSVVPALVFLVPEFSSNTSKSSSPKASAIFPTAPAAPHSQRPPSAPGSCSPLRWRHALRTNATAFHPRAPLHVRLDPSADPNANAGGTGAQQACRQHTTAAAAPAACPPRPAPSLGPELLPPGPAGLAAARPAPASADQ